MTGLPQPTRARLRSLILAGTNLTEMTNQLDIFETISKAYLTAKIIVVDNANLIENMNLVGGEPCAFSFDCGEGQIYSATLHLLQISGEKPAPALRAQKYTIDLIGEEYFKDKQNMVQQSFRGIQGTSIIQQLHSRYFGSQLRVLAQSLGPLSQEAYVISSRNPFTAIDDIRRKLSFPGFRTGNALYYRDRDGHVLGPLEALFSSLSGPTFIQEATWGKNWFDVVRAQNAIISAVATADINKGGRLGMQQIAASGIQEQRIFDWRQKREVLRRLAGRITPGTLSGVLNGAASQILSAAAGGHGGLPNYQVTDSAHQPLSADAALNTMNERLYAALARGGPSITVKVPIQSGITCTVGKGANLRLLPAMGDLTVLNNSASGLYLITDLCHSLSLEQRQFSAVTTMTCIRGGRDNIQ